ncbi:MAG: hypothetical protein P4N59_02895 [Negativicutes bacterium]|nr:hypothetical protein [Negativicutes bacterium]
MAIGNSTKVGWYIIRWERPCFWRRLRADATAAKSPQMRPPGGTNRLSIYMGLNAQPLLAGCTILPSPAIVERSPVDVAGS